MSRSTTMLWAIVALALAVRLAAMLSLPGTLFDPKVDPDAYRQFATTWRTTGVYGIVNSNFREEEGRGEPYTKLIPSAHRPPGYPFLLMVAQWIHPSSGIPIAALHLVAAAATVIATWQLARFVDSDIRPWLAALLVAIDPMLVHQSTLPMTETVFTAALAILLVVWLWRPQHFVWLRPVMLGVILGGAALIRPTIWPVWIALLVAQWSWDRFSLPIRGVERHRRKLWSLACDGLVATAIAVAVCVPWALRNRQTFGEWVFATTHGGYTLLLGQNPLFYEEEVVGGKIWQPNASLVDNLASANGFLLSKHEIDRDRFCAQSAVEWISENPRAAAITVAYHVRSLWWPLPRSGPEPLRIPVAVYMVALYWLVLVGIYRLRWRAAPLVAVLLAVTLIHAVYWSNQRFRAPLVPVLAVLAAAALPSKREEAECKSVPPTA